MPLLQSLRNLFGGRRSRRTAEPGAVMVFLEKSRWVTALIFCVTVIAIVVISSAGLHTANLPVLPNQLATATIDAAMPFSYESAHRTQQAREQILDRVPPVYALETKSLLKFEAAMRELQDQIAEVERFHKTEPAKGSDVLIGNIQRHRPLSR
jgi:cyclic-di-AMP phosphodiesterase PgpH